MMAPDLLGLQRLHECELGLISLHRLHWSSMTKEAGPERPCSGNRPNLSKEAIKGISNRTPSRPQQILRHHAGLKVLGRDVTYNSIATLLRIDGRHLKKTKPRFLYPPIYIY